METAFPTVDLKATGENIVRLRKQQGLSVKEVQMYFGFEQPQAIYKWQRGESLPSVDNLFALSRLLHTPIDGILIGNDRDFFILRNFSISENGVEIKLRKLIEFGSNTIVFFSFLGNCSTLESVGKSKFSRYGENNAENWNNMFMHQSYSIIMEK